MRPWCSRWPAARRHAARRKGRRASLRPPPRLPPRSHLHHRPRLARHRRPPPQHRRIMQSPNRESIRGGEGQGRVSVQSNGQVSKLRNRRGPPERPLPLAHACSSMCLSPCDVCLPQQCTAQRLPLRVDVRMLAWIGCEQWGGELRLPSPLVPPPSHNGDGAQGGQPAHNLGLA